MNDILTEKKISFRMKFKKTKKALTKKGLQCSKSDQVFW